MTQPGKPSLTATPDDADAAPSPWLLLATIGATKLVTLLLIVWASHSFETLLIVAVTTAPWVAAAAALLAGPIALRRRLRRARARRAELQRAEWMLTDPPARHPPASRPAER